MATALPQDSRPPEYCRFVPPDWRDGAATRHVVTDCMAFLERRGGSNGAPPSTHWPSSR
ncbi:hypothetical protein SAMN05216268_109142 [Streptomyces yunnanensis]|uniref:Uncharacterized protein n=1 Tax=Streptomyces yunnanensis TaxID=156453 RepID=A0A9X8MXN6_9ACTN|nr:hypothetical protein SAMN05216268_109142 [Streptomyces yunnanensis]